VLTYRAGAMALRHQDHHLAHVHSQVRGSRHQLYIAGSAGVVSALVESSFVSKGVLSF
jgi:hypothetical protein